MNHLGGYFRSGPQLHPAPSRLAVDTHADLHFVLSDIECGLAGCRHRAARQRYPDRAGRSIDPVAQGFQRGKVAPFFCRSTEDLLHDQRSRDAAPSRREGRGFHRDVVIGDHRLGRLSAHLARHVEVHDIALVILDDEQDAAAGIRGLGRRKNEIGRRRGKDLAGTCGVQHAVPDKAGMKRFVPRAAARYQGHLAGYQISTQNERRLLAHAHDVGMCRAKSGETFAQHALGGVDQLLHSGLPQNWSVRTFLRIIISLCFLFKHDLLGKPVPLFRIMLCRRRQMSSINLATFSANSLSSVSSLRFFCSLPRSGSISVRRRLRSRSFKSSSRRGCAR